MNLDSSKEYVIELCKRLNQKNMLAAGDGNVSFKVDQRTICITERSLNKSMLTVENFAFVDLDDKVIEGSPSTEYRMHTQVYRTERSAQAVIHAHPPYTIAWSISHPYASELPTNALPEVILGVGKIPVAHYGRPGTSDLVHNIEDILSSGNQCIIMARHGALSWGHDLTDAYNGMERIEHAAMILNYAQAYGGTKDLGAGEIDWLMNHRAKNSQRNL